MYIIKSIVIAAAIFSASAAFAADKSDNVHGSNEPSHRILIRSIDDGEVLWIENTYTVGTDATVAVGSHKISVMCEFITSYGTRMEPGEVTVQIAEGKSYDLSLAGPLSEQRCEVVAKERA